MLGSETFQKVGTCQNGRAAGYVLGVAFSQQPRIKIHFGYTHGKDDSCNESAALAKAYL